MPKSVVKRQELPGKTESRIGEEFRLRRGFADAVAAAECEEVSARAESAAGFEEAGREAGGDLCEAGFAVVMLVILEASRRIRVCSQGWQGRGGREGVGLGVEWCGIVKLGSREALGRREVLIAAISRV